MGKRVVAFKGFFQMSFFQIRAAWLVKALKSPGVDTRHETRDRIQETQDNFQRIQIQETGFRRHRIQIQKIFGQFSDNFRTIFRYFSDNFQRIFGHF